MKDKILFWIDNEWLHFGIAKFLQQIHAGHFYAIIDIEFGSRDFFQQQDLVHFEKSWYYREYVTKIEKQPDIAYLRNFEEKYGINLWQIAYNERFFFQFNPYYKFNATEILSILEKECRLFEKILDEVQPDFLIIKMTDSHQSHLIHELCKMKGIKVLMLGPTRFGYRYSIYTDYDDISEFSKPQFYKQRDLGQLKDFLKGHTALTEIKSFEKRTKISFWKRVVKYVRYLNLISNNDFKNYYANYGKTKLRVVSRMTFLKKAIRESFIDKNLVKKFDKNTKFVYFPLHMEPERSLLLVAPFYTNQLEIIIYIAKSIPADHRLFVKEHGSMIFTGWRETSYYKKILELPNVVLLHPSVSSEELLNHCSLVVTIGGTTGLEALFYNKPVIVMSDASYSIIPSVYRLRNIEDFPNAISSALNMKVDVSSLNEYVGIIEENSFDFDLSGLYADFNDFFVDDFNSNIGNISESKMILFLQKFEPKFMQLAEEYLKKINEHKTNKK